MFKKHSKEIKREDNFNMAICLRRFCLVNFHGDISIGQVTIGDYQMLAIGTNKNGMHCLDCAYDLV